MTITVSAAVTSTRMVRVTVTVDPSAPSQVMTLYRDSLSGDRVPVRGAISVPETSGSWDDSEAALNRPLWYVVVDHTGAEWISAAPVTLESRLSLLSHPITGELVEVTIKNWNEVKYPQRSTVLDVEGRRERVRLWDVEGSPESPEITLRTETAEQTRVVRALCAPGNTLLLRGACDGIEDAWLGLSSDRSEQRITTRASDARRHHVLADVLLTGQPEPTTRASGDTLGDLYNAVPTNLGDIAATWATLGEIAAADLQAGTL